MLAGVLILGGLAAGTALAHNGLGVNLGAGLKLGWGHWKEAHDRGSTSEVHLYDSGAVLVRGAEVTGKNSDEINARVKWSDATFNFTLNTDSDTRFVGNDDHNSFSEIDDGDIVSFYGKLDGATSSNIEVDAAVVRDWEK